MEIKGTGVWVGGYQAVEEPLQPLPENWSCPEDLAAMKRPRMYSLEALWPKSCFPVTVSEDQLSEVYTRGTDPWGTHMVPLAEKECCWTCRAFDTWNVRWNAELELESVRSELLAFRKTLSLSNPELSKKEFSFTLDKETRLQIIDFKETLTSQEKPQLLEAINLFKPLVSAINRHANSLVMLASYYKDKDGAGKLTKENFSALINYQELLSSSKKKNTYPSTADSLAVTPSQQKLISINA